MKNNLSKIAIVGTGTLFPGSLDSMEFWRNIVEGKDFITDVPPSHWLISDYYSKEIKDVMKTYGKRGAFLPEVDFDPMEFGMPPKTMTATDTVQLLSLLVCKKLIEDTNSLRLNKVNKKKVSVILGIAAGTELIEQMSAKVQRPVWVKALRENGLAESLVQTVCQDIEDSYPEWTEDTFPGLLANVVAGRITNRFDFGGANCVVDAACASSVSAMMMSMQQLQLGTTDLVITGGADALNNIFMYMCFSKTPALSPTGDIRPFSENGDGTMLGEGFSMMALRRLEDAEADGDKIYAVINGIGASSDGRAKSVYAPDSAGQALAIERAYEGLPYSLSDVELVEAHGTGTNAGDLAEFNGLQLAFNKAEAKQFCALGTIKSQFGHTKSSAGSAGVFKAAMALHHKVLPPTIKVDKPDPKLEIEDTPFYLNTRSRPWIHDSQTNRKASVSSFGFGGSNYHVALEEYRGPNKADRFYFPKTELILIDAQDTNELESKFSKLLDSCEEGRFWVLAKDSQAEFNPEGSMRLAILSENKDILTKLFSTVIEKIKTDPQSSYSLPDKFYFESQTIKGKMAFLFSGQGSQYVNMGVDLAMNFTAAGEAWDIASGLKLDKEYKLNEIVFPIPAFDKETEDSYITRLTKTEWAQPAIGGVALSQYSLLKKMNVFPDCTAGHSYGEIPALYAAGVIGSVKDVFQISRKRGELMANASKEKGTMTAVVGNESDVKGLIDDSRTRVSIANINSPVQVVVAGRVPEIEKFEEYCSNKNIGFFRLSVATAFHTDLVSNSADAFYEFLKEVEFSKPELTVYSNTTGEKYSEDKEEIRKVLAWQLAKPVRFSDQIEAMYESGVRIFLELGPGNVLSKLTGKCLEGREYKAISLDGSKHQEGKAAFFSALGQLAVAGVSIDFNSLWEEFDTADLSLINRDPKARTLKIKGSNYQKVYPPENGDAGIPKPNPESTQPQSAHPDSAQPELNQHVPAQPSNGWMRAFSEVQKNTLEAQKAFQNTIAESHAQFLKASELAFQQLGAMGGVPQQIQENMQTSIAPPSIIQPAPVFTPVPVPDLNESDVSVVSPAPLLDPKTVLLSVVAEKTGYPEEMLEMDLDMETGLGIDSIKRVEILSALQEKMPELKKLDINQLAAAKTLQEIMDVSMTLLKSISTQTAETANASIAAPAHELQETKKALPSIDAKALLLTVVAEKTGYPEEMLEMDLDMETGLGIDSIKRVEILSALQQKIPELKGLDQNKLASAKTLQEIMDISNRLLGGEPLTGSDQKKTEKKSSSGKIYRYIVNKVPAPPCGVALAGLGDSILYLVKDNKGVAEVLAEKFSAINIEVVVVENVQKEARSVVFLKGIDELPEKNPVQYALDINKKAFEAANRCGQAILKNGGLFVAVQDRGIDSSGERADRVWSAGLGALVKTAAWEWQKASLKSIDIVCKDRSPEDLAQSIFDELISGGPETEVFLSNDSARYSIETKEEIVNSKTRPVKDGDTVVVSGGARGVTAECILELSKEAKLNIAILARTELLDEPDYLKNCTTDADIKQGILNSTKERGEKLTPIELNSLAKKIISCREVRGYISKMKNNGSDVQYYSIDVLNSSQVEKTIENIRDKFGKIDILIHGAGVLADKLIHEKTEEQFDKVFSTKVIGFKNLLDATEKDNLSYISCFSSIAARTGNAGQVDYSMANEVLNQVCRAEKIKRNGKTIVKSINWGPWEGGMVSAELKVHFESMGVILIPLKEGARAFVDELIDESANVEVVIGTKLDTWSAPKEKSQKLNWDMWIQEKRFPYLSSHRINGIAVVPVMMINELCLRLSSALFPKKTVKEVKDLKVLKGIKLEHFEDKGDWFEISCLLEEENNKTQLNFEISSKSGVKHYSLQIVLDDEVKLEPPVFEINKGNREIWDWTHETAYNEKLFHGKHFQVIKELNEFSSTGCSGTLKSGVKLTESTNLWRSDMALLDGGLQLALLWMLKNNSKDSLPVSFDSFTLYKNPAEKTEVYCDLQIVKNDMMGAICNIIYINTKEEVLAEIKGLQIIVYGD